MLVSWPRARRSASDEYGIDGDDPGTSAAVVSAVAGAAGQTLDELMLAMDVVDTLRHQDNLVARELDESRREAELIARLRQIYESQGLPFPTPS